jgi:hypothetical protein
MCIVIAPQLMLYKALKLKHKSATSVAIFDSDLSTQQRLALRPKNAMFLQTALVAPPPQDTALSS